MKKHTSKKNTGVWNYLHTTGVLEWGTKEDILEHKKEYRKQYFREYKQKQRKRKFEFTILLTAPEKDILTKHAKNHTMSLSHFIKQSALAYLQNHYLVPHPNQVAQIEQHLSLCLLNIEKIAEKGDFRLFTRERTFNTLYQHIEGLEAAIYPLIKTPSPLLHNIQEALAADPAFKEKLRALL